MSAHGQEKSNLVQLVQRIENIGERAEGSQHPTEPLPELAVLRNHAASKIASRTFSPSNVAHIDLARLQKVGMVTPTGGRTRVVDEYRLIKRPILYNAVQLSQEKRGNLVMVTSAQPGEGKTFTAISLAMSILAEKNIHVLLVDLDVARQNLCRTLGMSSEKGLINLLNDTASSLSEVFVQTDLPHLTVLPAGADDPLAPELLASAKMHRFMGHLSNQYRSHLVIIDTAPALVSTDTSMLAKNVGQVIMVVEANRTGRASVEEAVSLVKGCEQISFLLNRVALSDMIYQYGSYYGDRYDGETKASLPERIVALVSRRWPGLRKTGGK